MARYSLRTRTTVTTSGAASYELICTSAARRIRLMELGIFLGAATASTYGLGRPAAIGVTPTSPVAFLPEDPADVTGLSTTAVAWGTGPTVPANFFRVVALPATIGAGIIWSFGPAGLVIPNTGISTLVLWNITANSAVTDVYAVIDDA